MNSVLSDEALATRCGARNGQNELYKRTHKQRSLAGSGGDGDDGDDGVTNSQGEGQFGRAQNQQQQQQERRSVAENQQHSTQNC